MHEQLIKEARAACTVASGDLNSQGLVKRLADALEQKTAEAAVQGRISASIFRDLVGRESEVAAAIARAETAERASNAWEANALVYAQNAATAERRVAELEKDWPAICEACSKSISVHGWFRAPDSSFRPHALCQGCMEKWVHAGLEQRAEAAERRVTELERRQEIIHGAP